MHLPQIFGRAADRGALEGQFQINWGFFFQGAGPANSVTSRPIDTRLAHFFQQLPPDLIGTVPISCPHARLATNPGQLAVRTLLRGAGLRLATGQSVAKVLGERMLTKAELGHNAANEQTEQARILRDGGLLHETPLWYYILKESELRHNGNRVGSMGSRIVAETIYAAIRFDPNSYWNFPGKRKLPPIWNFPDGPQRIYGLSEFFRLAQLF
jgi:hypothetical protein